MSRTSGAVALAAAVRRAATAGAARRRRDPLRWREAGLLDHRQAGRDLVAALMHHPTHRAVLAIATDDHVEHWEVQRRKRDWFGREYWERVARVATQELAQQLVNRLEHDGVVYPTERASSWLE